MTDTLPTRLRDGNLFADRVEAADRIEALQAEQAEVNTFNNSVIGERNEQIAKLRADQELSVQTMAQQYNTMLELRAEVEQLKKNILDELPTLEKMTARFGEVAAENITLQSRLTALEGQERILRHDLRVHLSNRYAYSHGEFCQKLEEILAPGAAQKVEQGQDCCEHCDDGDGLCIFPMYGTAPHTHDTGNGWIGSTRILPKERWGDNFREDPDCEGHGVYMRCEHCGRGEQQAEPKERV